MKGNLLLLSSMLLSICLLSFCGCGEVNDPIGPDLDPEPKPEPEDTIVNVLKTIEGYPKGVTLQYFEDYFEDKSKCSGYIATIDFEKNHSLDFNAVHLSTAMTPSEAHSTFSSAEHTAIITTNAGYFWDGASLSLLIDDGEVMDIASNYAYVTVQGKTKTVYPVRAAFARSNKGENCFEATWVYCCMDDDNRPYSFPSPLDNNERTKSYLRSAPSSKSKNATLWEPYEAVGGGPMIVYEGKNVAEEYYWREILDEGGTAGLSNQPRTVIGATDDNRLVLMVCDGRGMNGSIGFTLSQAADKLISMGVVTAVNLDGGGSSTMVGMDGRVLNRPSDSGNGPDIIQRNIPTAIIISQNK